MDESQIQLIKDKTFLDIRAKIAQVLLDQGILDTYEGTVGWWVNGSVPMFVSLYEVLEEVRD